MLSSSDPRHWPRGIERTYANVKADYRKRANAPRIPVPNIHALKQLASRGAWVDGKFSFRGAPTCYCTSADVGFPLHVVDRLTMTRFCR